MLEKTFEEKQQLKKLKKELKLKKGLLNTPEDSLLLYQQMISLKKENPNSILSFVK